VGRFTVRHDALRVTNDAQKQMITGHVSVFQDGKPIGEMTPAKWYFAKHEQEPTTEVAIRRAVSEDLYVVLSGYDISKQTGVYAVTLNPLVNWIWLGFAVMALGTALTLLPEAAFAFAVAKVPEGAATTTLLLLSVLLWPAALVGQTVQATPRSALERRLEGEILCTCGCRRPLNNCGMLNCAGHADQTAKLRRLLSEGKDHDAVIAAFIKDYGDQSILAAPVDKGFNRLAWLFPYLVGATGAASLAVVAFRLSRREAEAGTSSQNDAGDDPDLRARLDDELRDLD
jgi:cytochrome c-type biogenesis protein CcmF